MSRVDILRLAPEDWQACRAIRLEALEREPRYYATTLQQDIALSEADWRARLANPDAGTFGVSVDDELVGTAGWYLPSAANSRHRAVVVGVYLRAAHRGKGLGRRLLDAVVAEAETRAEDLSLQVAVDNIAALQLYRSIGFRVAATVPRTLKFAGTAYDEHLMLRD